MLPYMLKHLTKQMSQYNIAINILFVEVKDLACSLRVLSQRIQIAESLDLVHLAFTNSAPFNEIDNIDVCCSTVPKSLVSRK
jgi:hypothetical protein